MVGLISWWPVRLFWGFQYRHFCSVSSAALTGSTAHHCEYFFVCLFFCLSVGFFCWCFYNHKPFIIVCLKCQLMMFYHAHIYICTAQKTADSVTFTEETLNGQPHFLCTDIYAHILTYTLAHTNTPIHIKCYLQLSIVVIWWYLNVTSLTNNILTFY